MLPTEQHDDFDILSSENESLIQDSETVMAITRKPVNIASMNKMIVKVKGTVVSPTLKEDDGMDMQEQRIVSRLRRIARQTKGLYAPWVNAGHCLPWIRDIVQGDAEYTSASITYMPEKFRFPPQEHMERSLRRTPIAVDETRRLVILENDEVEWLTKDGAIKRTDLAVMLTTFAKIDTELIPITESTQNADMDLLTSAFEGIGTTR